MEGSSIQKRLSDEGHKLYRIRQTCMKMLEKRGYNVLKEHISMTSEKFCEAFGPDPSRESMTLLVEKVRFTNSVLLEHKNNISTYSRLLRTVGNSSCQRGENQYKLLYRSLLKTFQTEMIRLKKINRWPEKAEMYYLEVERSKI